MSGRHYSVYFGGHTEVKIGHLVESLDPHGIAAGLVDLATAGRDTDIELVVVSFTRTGNPAVPAALRRAGTQVVELNMAPWDPRAALRVADELRGHDVDLVHSHGVRADVVGPAAATRLRVPAMSTLHHIHADPADRGDRIRRTAKVLARKRFMTRTIATSHLQRDWYRRLAGSTAGLSVVPDGAADPGLGTPQERARLRRDLGVGDDEVIAVSVTPMRRGQGQDLLLDALAGVPAGEPLTVVLAGDGPLRPWLESRVAADETVSGRVQFHRSADRVELLRAADIQLHLTRADTMPRALVLGQGTGTPAVATRVGGIPEIVTRDTGALVPMSAQRVADEIVRLVNDPDLRRRQGEAARARFLTTFEAGVWAARLAEIYRSALGRAGATPPEQLDAPEPTRP